MLQSMGRKQTWQWLKNNQRGFPRGSSSKESTCNAGDTGGVGLIPGSGRSSGGGNGNPLQCSCLENPMDRGAWWATAHGVKKNWTWLSMHVLLFPHKRDPRELSLCVKTQWEDNHLRTRKRALTSHWVCQHLALGLLSTQNWEVSIFYKPSRVFYSIPSRLRWLVKHAHTLGLWGLSKPTESESSAEDAQNLYF